ncbi:LacI family DNA-binding transcriptional regulator [Acerihabitans sp. TG2]|uniref:LacI family DNA-binding transcriptional regulator n=1 Tax=Acerihabitans sp. TG2 TaxID=3096008 RepID=UPI002B23D547|nr:LacI family DNA-binding transcriptional regulator [Acerihabitans sp. TG2]MEA9391280.1 LacI family DNA-binding transcriptional regulator [Acerihabitans sp. TG2]
MSTIKQVAVLAGVTPTTVTNVLRGRGRVSEATRQRVLAAVAEQGYRPNLNARALVERKSPTLALMLSCITNPFYPEFSLHAHLATRRCGRFLLVCNTDYESDGGVQFLEEVAGSLCDGVLVANRGGLDIDQLIAMQARGISVVISCWESPERHPGIACVAFDAKRAGEMATEHLIALGHQHIGAIIASPLAGIHGGRYQGYLAALNHAGLMADSRYTTVCVDSFASGYEAARSLLTQHPEISALFVSNDLPALGVLDAAADLQIVVPQKLSVVSITGIELAGQSRPSLTTVAIPTAEMAARSIELLLEMIADTPPSAPMICIPSLTLMARQSTSRPAE